MNKLKNRRFLLFIVTIILSIGTIMAVIPLQAFATPGDVFIEGGLQYKVIADPLGPADGVVHLIANNYSGSITVPSKVTHAGGIYAVPKIDDFAFDGCVGLTEVIISPGIRDIGNNAFSGCTGLTKITLPYNFRSVGANAFSDCTSLSIVICQCANPPTFGANAFSGTPPIAFRVPTMSAESYKKNLDGTGLAAGTTINTTPIESIGSTSGSGGAIGDIDPDAPVNISLNAPKNFRMIPGIRQVTLMWDVDPLAAYYEVTLDGGENWIQAPESGTHTFTELEYAFYAFAVRAVNEGGAGHVTTGIGAPIDPKNGKKPGSSIMGNKTGNQTSDDSYYQQYANNYDSGDNTNYGAFPKYSNGYGSYANDGTGTQNGVSVHGASNGYDRDAKVNETYVYNFINGENLQVTPNTYNDATFRVDADYDDFIYVKVNGQNVDPSNFTSSSGSTIVTLKESYLDTLGPGEHTITLGFTDGSAETSFSLTEEADAKVKKAEAEIESNPSTGNVQGVVTILSVIAVIAAGITLYLRKKKVGNVK